MAVGSLLSSRLGDLLVQDGRLTPPQLEAARSRARLTNARLEEALLDVGVISEADLLRFLAMQHRTRFVSTERLARAEIDPQTIERVSARLAEHAMVFPVLFDAAAGVLSVVTPDPDDTLTLGELARSGVRDVRAFIARPAAVRAAIARAYRGDARAFDSLLSQPEPLNVPSDWNTPRPAVLPSMHGLQNTALAAAPAPPGPGQARAAVPANRHRTEHALPPNVQRKLTFSHDLDGPSGREITGVPARNRPSGPGDLPLPNAPPPPGGSPWGGNTGAPGWLGSSPAGGRAVSDRRATGTGGTNPRTDTRHPAIEPVVVPIASFLETLNVMVTMLEADRGDLRGHSADTARLGRQVAERVGLPVNDVDDISTACFIHDFGKIGPRHLTPYNAAEDMAVRVSCDRSWSAPSRLLETSGLRPLALATVNEMYERFDGNGVPEKKRGKDIPIGARILALVDSYSDLTHSTKNAQKRPLTPAEACEALRVHRGTVFDPSLVDLLTQIVAPADKAQRGERPRHQVLLVDADPEETLVVEMRLIQQGFSVRVARSVDAAMNILLAEEIDAIVTELELGQGGNGFELLDQARRNTKTRDVPCLVLTTRDQGQETERAFDLGVVDFILKPPNINVLAAKLRQAVEHRRPTQAANRVSGPGAPAGVSGNLSDMGLPELIQILWQGRKSGTLTVRSGAQFGEIVFVDGQIYDAAWAKYRKEAAFYALIALTEGDFQLTTGGTPPERKIEGSPDMLLLEAMRRMDEGLAPDQEG
jgi:response regulator RpfG family c-di-GMP phosphodiesterase